MSGYRLILRGSPSRHRLQDYRCTGCHHEFELSVDGSDIPNSAQCPTGCGDFAEKMLSAPMLGTVYGSPGSRGKSDPPPPGALDTRALAEGMPLSEWKAKRRKQQRDATWSENRAKTGATGKLYST